MGFFGVCDDGGFLTLSHVEDYSTNIWDVTEKVWLRAMYSDGIAAQTRKTEGDLKTEG